MPKERRQRFLGGMASVVAGLVLAALLYTDILAFDLGW